MGVGVSKEQIKFTYLIFSQKLFKTTVGPSAKNIARIANAVPVTLYSRVTMNVELVALNCLNCLKSHKSQRWLFEGVL